MTKKSDPSTPVTSRIDHPPVATTGDGMPLPAPPHRALLMLMLALVAGLSLTQWLNHRSATRTLIGYLRAERNVIVSPAEGTVQEIHQLPGTIVKPGMVVVLLTDARLERQITAHRRTLATLQAAQVQARAQADVELALRLRDLEREEFEVRTLSATHLEKQYYNEFVRTASEDLIQRSDGVASNGSDDQIFRLGVLPQLLTGDGGPDASGHATAGRPECRDDQCRPDPTLPQTNHADRAVADEPAQPGPPGDGC